MALQNSRKNGNGSGMGKGSAVPDVVARKFNWGAFFLTFIWGIGNKSYITLLILLAAVIPILPLGMCIWFGIMGNRWAWQNKEYSSVEEFQQIQKNWAIAGLTIVSIMAAIILGSVMMQMLNTTGGSVM